MCLITELLKKTVACYNIQHFLCSLAASILQLVDHSGLDGVGKQASSVDDRPSVPERGKRVLLACSKFVSVCQVREEHVVWSRTAKQGGHGQSWIGPCLRTFIEVWGRRALSWGWSRWHRSHGGGAPKSEKKGASKPAATT